ncbi:MAG TPA: RluA family pseudouridine synthase [bacterium]|nr:RluA family pseudouridine synthase [bacterium]
MAAAQKIRFEAGPKDAGRRLDQVLADNVPGLSRRKARVLLDIGGVFVDGARVKVAGKTIRKGQKIEAVLGGAFDRATPKTGKAARAKDEEVLPAFDVVYEDADVVVVDKPAGLLTAPTPESDRGNLAKLLAARFGQIFVVHRIDLETSGLLVFARTEEANRVLSLRFSTHDIEREYLAVVRGRWPDSGPPLVGPSASRQAPTTRSEASLVDTVDHPVSGKRAVTHFTVERRFGELATELRARLETGRTHQIRIHARVKGYPVAGDSQHGVEDPALTPPRMALHATRLGFAHPVTGEMLRFERPWPKDIADWIAGLPPTK